MKNLRMLTVTITDSGTLQTIKTTLCIPIHDTYLIKDSDTIYVKNKYTDNTLATIKDLTVWDELYNKYCHEEEENG